jgi:hypothetical protein
MDIQNSNKRNIPKLWSEGLVALTTWHPLSAKVCTSFADRRRSLHRYSSLADSKPRSFFLNWLQSEANALEYHSLNISSWYVSLKLINKVFRNGLLTSQTIGGSLIRGPLTHVVRHWSNGFSYSWNRRETVIIPRKSALALYRLFRCVTQQTRHFYIHVPQFESGQVSGQTWNPKEGAGNVSRDCCLSVSHISDVAMNIQGRQNDWQRKQEPFGEKLAPSRKRHPHHNQHNTDLGLSQGFSGEATESCSEMKWVSVSQTWLKLIWDFYLLGYNAE